jgi:hypothetical protein
MLELLMGEGRATRWLKNRLVRLDPGWRRSRVGGGTKLETSVVVRKRFFTEFFDKLVRESF